jgi:hypothetical protein
MIKLEFTFNPLEDLDYPEKIKTIVNAEKNKEKINTLYDSVFRKHLKYDHPAVGKKLTARDKQVIELILYNINKHFGDDS